MLSDILVLGFIGLVLAFCALFAFLAVSGGNEPPDE